MQLKLIDYFLWVGILVNLIISIAYPNYASSILATVFYVLLIFRLIKTYPIALLLFSPILFLQFSVLISTNAIEAGGFMKEMGRVGYPSVANASYVLISAMFILFATLGFLGKKNNQTESFTRPIQNSHVFIREWAAFSLTVFIIFILLLKGSFTGFPLIEGFDRFAYRRLSGDPITTNFLNMKIVIASFLGASASACNSHFAKLRHHILFVAYLVVSFLFADKFFTIITASLYYVAIQFASKPEQIKGNFKRFFIPAMLAILLATAMTTYIYSGRGAYGIDKTVDLLTGRFSEQGQLWFVTVNDRPKLVSFDTNGVVNNISCLVAKPSSQDCVFNKKLGPFYFIEKYSPSRVYWSFVRNMGYVSPIMAFEPYMLVLFGALGLILVVVCVGLLFGYVCNRLVSSLHTRNPFNVLLPAFIIFQMYYLYVTGNIFTVIGLGTIKGYIAFFVLQIVVNNWIKFTSARTIKS